MDFGSISIQKRGAIENDFFLVFPPCVITDLFDNRLFSLFTFGIAM
jgi:hypothetical protein